MLTHETSDDSTCSVLGQDQNTQNNECKIGSGYRNRGNFTGLGDTCLQHPASAHFPVSLPSVLGCGR